MTTRPPLAEKLDLQPHPEGGWYRETFRSAVTFRPQGYAGPRAAATGIYFLLQPGEFSAWHVVASDELWFLHSGSLELRYGGSGPAPAEDGGTVPAEGGGTVPGEGGGTVLLTAENPQALVPSGVWQSAYPVGGEPALVSCVVSPGFDFADFRLA
jgi:hypothetical protein